MNKVSKAAELRLALLSLLEEHERDGMIPTSSRFLFYELVGRGIVSKEGARPDNPVIAALTQLRKTNQVPWHWIADETRSVSDFTGYVSVKEGMLARLPSTCIDPWNGMAPFVITESRSLAGALENVAGDYRVLIAATNGQCGGFLHTDIRPRLGYGTKQRLVLYMGDFDLAGNDIEANTRKVLGYGMKIFGQETGSEYDSHWERIALTESQVDSYGLEPIIKNDRRFSGEDGVHEAVETEALSQLVITQILEDKLSGLLPEPLESVLAREEAERAEISRLLD